MKKILLVGNSHASGIYKEINGRPDVLHGVAELYFYVIPGGLGPHLVVENDRLVLTNFTKSHPPYHSPASTPDMPVSSFDAFFISALGFVCGYRHQNPIQTCALLAEYGPIPSVGALRPLLSDTCYRALVAGDLEGQDGFRFLANLRASTDKPIAVQPYPYLSDEILDRADWKMKSFYRDVEGANRFFSQAKDAALVAACDRSQAFFLGYPDTTWSNVGLTPRLLMQSIANDMMHGGPEYAKLVVDQIRRWASSL